MQWGSSNEQMNIWDIFRKDTPEHKQEKVSKAKQILRVVKVVVYLVLFFLVFLGSIVTKASLQILTNEFNKEKKAEFSINFAKDAIAYYILFILAIPDAVQMLISIFKFVFGTRTLPTIEEIVIMVVKECLHMLCLAIIVYKVMPILNSVEVCAFLAGMPLVPSILHTISYQEDEVSYRPILNVLSILLQAAAVCAVPLYKFFEDQITTEETFWMIFATFIASIRWFEKYFKYSSGGTIVLKILSDYSNRIETQCASTLATSCCRLVLILILFPIYFAQNIHRPDTAFEWKPERLIECLEAQLNITCSTHYADTSMMTPFLVHFCASMGLYYAAVLATRICMDQICFFAALSLGTPVYVVIILISRVNDNWISNTFIKDVENMDLYVMAVVFVIAWLFQLRSCRRIWDSSHDRVVYKNKLFFLPHYCSPIADLSLLHSRRIAPEITGTGSSDTNKQTMTEVYICATMWHENRTEMTQIIESLFRIDKDQAARQNDNKKVYKDKYKFEAHILFDDAMKTSEENADGKRKREPNEFVKQLMDIITRNESTVKKTNYITPYGGTLNYTMPGNNKLVVHLKDKDKIRHKKRWSQIMYMYYLLGYKLMKEEKDPLKKEHDSKNRKNASSIRDVLSPAIIQKAENTYIMALDGDVDFSPEALQLLIDRMKTNPKVGAACGRIKPGGSGPVVWYQKFEYAIGHWLQKSAEHVFGCVLCSPGCFSLFRAIALMDDNIMNKYASLPTEPKHYLQYDQGEDRWLCTLMLQQGYRIEYCSAAEAVTFAPEEFREFFNQRRRWVPSTMANILDLLISYKRTTTKNSNISRLYILYQGLLFISSILGPSLVLLVMQSAISLVFKENVSPLVSYLLVYGPTLFFIIICLKCKTQTQLTAAMVLSAIYALFMVAVLVGTAVNIAEEGSFTPTAVFMYVLTGIFLAAGLFHPHELTDLLWGSLYFLCIPAGYLFLIVYAICNLNNVSWGTRETQTAIVEQQFDGKQQRKNILLNEFRDVSEDILGGIIKQIKATNVKEAWYTDLIPAYFQCHNNNALLRSIESVQNIVKNTESTVHDDFKLQKQKDKSSGSRSSKLDEISWAGDERKTLQDDEILFWNGFIKKYLKPIDSDKQKEKEIAQSLKEYRDKVAFAFFFVNAMWVVVMSAMNEVKGQLNIQIPAIGSNTVIEPLGLLFLLIFTILLFLQFIGMVRHRYGTFLHVLSATTLNQNEEKSVSYSEDAEDVHVHEHDASDTSPKDKTRRDGCYSLKNIVIIIAKEIFLYLAHHNE